MTNIPQNHNNPLNHFRGDRDKAGLPCLGIRAGRLGEGGGDFMRWLKLNREEEDDSGPRSFGSYPDLRKLSRGDVRDERSISACE